MNRQIELSELISKSFIESTNKMSQDDKLAFYQAILDGDKNIEREILKKYNYTMVTPVENIMSDEDAEALANSLLKDEKGVFNEINNLFVSASKKYDRVGQNERPREFLQQQPRVYPLRLHRPADKKTRPQRLDGARVYVRQHPDRRRENPPVPETHSADPAHYHGRQRAGRSCGRPVRGQLHNRRGLYQNGPTLCVF